MKRVKIIFVLLLSMCLSIAAIGCVTENEDNSSSTPSSSPSSDVQPVEKVNIGVVFGDDIEEKELIEIDYKNALAGLLFFDKASSELQPIDLELTALTVDGANVDTASYQYSSGILEFTEEYLKTLTLGQTYTVKAVFDQNTVEFSVNMTDNEAPAFKYLANDMLKDVYLLGSNINLPLASKSPSSIQNISASYSLTDEQGSVVTYSDNKFAAETAGTYKYTATFVKNGENHSTSEKTFTVIDLNSANLADKNCAAVLGGSYEEQEQAALLKGTNTLQQIEVDQAYKYVRVNFKGTGSITFDENTRELSSEEYKTVWLTVTDFNSMQINATGNLYVKSLKLSQTSAFTEEDIEVLDFSKEEFLSLWSYNSDYGTPEFNSELEGISFEGTNNSWPYALRAGIIKTAYDNGYKYLVISYTGKGTTRVFNDTTGDWGGYGKDLAQVETTKRLAYNLDETAKKAEINETSGFSIITNSDALVLSEFRFYKTDVVVEEEGIYNTMNLVESSLVDKWSHNSAVSDAASYNENEQALSFPANGNTDTFNFEHDALRKAQKKGYNAVTFTVKGSSGEISLFVDGNWDRNVKFAVKTKGEYVQGVLLFGDLIFNEKSGIAILSSNEAGGDPVLVKEMKFAYIEPTAEPDYTVANLAAKDLIDKWYYNEGSGVTPYYDDAEEALVLPANGNYDTYTFSNKAVKAAKDKGFNAITFTVKGKNASIRVFVSGSWNSDAIYNVNSESEYTTFTMHFAHLNVDENSGITILVSDAVGGTALYVKQLKFETITVDQTVMKLMTGNLVSKDNLALWQSDGKASTVSYDEENGCMKFDYTAVCDVRLNVEELFKYAKLFGRSKIVWTRVDTGARTEDGKAVDYYGRLRLYENEAKFSEGNGSADTSVNILGNSVNGARVMEIDITQATEDYIFAIGNQKGNDTHIRISELYFA